MNNPSNERRVFVIPSPNLPSFQEKLEKLVRRAKKIGCEIPSYEIIKEEPKTIQVLVDEVKDDFGRVFPVYEDRVILLHHIVLNSSVVKVAGFEFCCTIEHTEEGNILHTLKGMSVPNEYRDCKPWCDHCKTLRRRNDTFVVRNAESNQYLQVGRNCLADFLGRDASNAAAMAELYFEFDELASASEEEGTGSWGSSGQRFDYLEKFLGYVAEVISQKGWLSRSAAKEKDGDTYNSTCDVALFHMRAKQFERGMLFRFPTEKSVETAKLAIEWAENIPDAEVENSEYLHNIRVIARRGIVNSKQYGYAASIVSGYQKHINELKRVEIGKKSQYVGEIGKRTEFIVNVEKVLSIESAYGYSSLHIMSDANGNRLIWKSTSETLEVNSTVKLKGTVKQHQEYKGVKQTVLSRCKVV